MINNRTNKIRALAAAAPVLLLTACVNHMDNGEYISTGEIMAGAFSNLLIGMGTVFAVLIFLTWVISLFKHVGKLEKAFDSSGQKKMKTAGKRKKHAVQSLGETAAEAADEEAAQSVKLSSITPAPAGEELQAVIAAAIAAYEADMAAGAAIPARPKQPALQNGIRIQTYRRA